MDLEELRELIKTKEGHKLEFKEKPSKNLTKEMVAFANADGGRILIG
ncbi:MAG: helix-turn-helix domain-containing protein, partial [archaeon]